MSTQDDVNNIVEDFATAKRTYSAAQDLALERANRLLISMGYGPGTVLPSYQREYSSQVRAYRVFGARISHAVLGIGLGPLRKDGELAMNAGMQFERLEIFLRKVQP